MTLGEKLLNLRQKAGMSQDALAEKLDVSRQAVSKWERDEAVPETDKIIKLAQLFQVSTDSLLLNGEEPQPSPPIQPHQPKPHAYSSDRIERFIRRHGYKSGYFLIGAGAFLCIIALLIFTLLPQFGSGMFDAGNSSGNNWMSGIYIEGDLPPDVLDAIYDQAGAGLGSGGFFGGFEDEYQQSVNQMQQGWRQTMGIMAAFAGIPILLAGIALITLGSVIVVKGKKISDQTV